MMNDSRRAFLEIRRCGDLDAAERHLRKLSDSAWKFAALAQIAAVKNATEDEVKGILRRAESMLTSVDYDGHMELFKAYELGLGDGGFEENMRTAHSHLIAAANADLGVDAILALARRLASGTAVIDPSPSEAMHWYGVAELRGSDEAAEELKRLRSRIN